MPAPDTAGGYTPEFFDAHEQRSLDSAAAVLPPILSLLSPKSVVDVGCGRGTWLRAAQNLGVTTLFGVDGAYVDSGALLIDPRHFLAIDLQADFASALSDAGQARFDLVLCLEVAEHLPYAAAEGFVERLTRVGDAVLFSAAVPFQTGTGHVNEQWPEFWALHFRRRGYRCYDIVRPAIWGRADVDWWYAQNVLLYVRDGTPAAACLPTDAQRDGVPLAVVHPQNYLFQVLYTYRPYRAAARGEETEDLAELTQAWVAGSSDVPDLRAVERAAGAAPTARNVFPYTRSELASPEAETARRIQAERRVAQLSDEISVLRRRLADAERHRSVMRQPQ